jgi:hypothetical protein
MRSLPGFGPRPDTAYSVPSDFAVIAPACSRTSAGGSHISEFGVERARSTKALLNPAAANISFWSWAASASSLALIPGNAGAWNPNFAPFRRIRFRPPANAIVQADRQFADTYASNCRSRINEFSFAASPIRPPTLSRCTTLICREAFRIFTKSSVRPYLNPPVISASVPLRITRMEYAGMSGSSKNAMREVSASCGSPVVTKEPSKRSNPKNTATLARPAHGERLPSITRAAMCRLAVRHTPTNCHVTMANTPTQIVTMVASMARGS